MRDRGFTLIEILVVVLSIGVLVALGIPRFVDPEAKHGSRRLRGSKGLCVRR
jgi:prepilin-type N-terminal cleavage/methylation domain-containing protein